MTFLLPRFAGEEEGPQPTISPSGKNWAISTLAVSAASDPCTEFSPIDLA